MFKCVSMDCQPSSYCSEEPSTEELELPRLYLLILTLLTLHFDEHDWILACCLICGSLVGMVVSRSGSLV